MTSARAGVMRVAAAAAAIGLASACAATLRETVDGTVVDRETRTPIEGAVVRWDRTANCPGLFHGNTPHELPDVEARTDAAGRFALRRGLLRPAPCANVIWSESLRILAPGYRPYGIYDSGIRFQPDEPVRSGQFDLSRFRYRLEVERFRAVWTRVSEASGHIWQAAVATALARPFVPAGPAGVFVSEPGARFDRVAVTRVDFGTHDSRSPIVLAQDSVTGQVRGWTARGEALSLPWSGKERLDLVNGDRSTDPVLTTGSRLYWARGHEAVREPLDSPLWLTFPVRGDRVRAAVNPATLLTWEGADTVVRHEPAVSRGRGSAPAVASRQPWTELLPHIASPVECMSTIGRASGGVLVVVAQGSSWLVPNWRTHAATWQADRVPFPTEVAATPLVACAGGLDGLYVASRGGRIHALRLNRQPRQAATWEVGVPFGPGAASGAPEIRAISVSTLDFAEVLYVVTGGESVYRFSASGQPDQRVAPAP
jgi:hypothetical protein